MPSAHVLPAFGAALALLSFACPASATDVQADPTNYQQLLGTLKPGDTLHLAAGTYVTLAPTNLNGTTAQWITITGPVVDPPAAIVQASPDGCCDVVEITNSSFLAIENLLVDGNHVPGAFGISAKGGTSNVVHDVRIESDTIVDCDNDGQDAGPGNDDGQQDDGISTKTPTWGWIIRQNKILGAGTGLYLGNSDGSDPFTGGLIEENLVANSIGYDMEIKWQATPRQSAPGQPQGPSSTIIRNNVWIKDDTPCDEALYCRPNLLVGGFATSGPGSQDETQIYGNFFDHNPSEQGLLQVSGNVTVHDNVLVDAPQAWGIYASDHDGAPLTTAHVYNNTIYGVAQGIAFGNAAAVGDAVIGNLVFSATPTTGPIAHASENLSDTVSNAPQYVAAPSTALGQMNFYPLAGQCTGAPIDESAFASEVDYDVDFNGTPKGSFTYRGAYAGSGSNPGWPLGDGFKDGGASSGADASLEGGGGGGPDAAPGGASDASGTEGDATSGNGETPPEGHGSGGCGCAQAGAATSVAAVWGMLVAVGAGLVRRRRRR